MGLFEILSSEQTRMFVFNILCQVKNTDGLQEQNEQKNRCYKTYHHIVQCLSSHMTTVFLYFVCDKLRSQYPADQDAGQDRYDGHHYIVADVIHHIQYLSHGTIGQFEFKVKMVVAKAYYHSQCQRNHKTDYAGNTAGDVEAVHKAGNDGFHDGYGRGNGCKQYHQKEYDTDDHADTTHGAEDLGQGYEHQAGACSHTFFAHENKHGRNDHHTGQESRQCIENLDLVDGFTHINIVFHVGTVGNHNTHGHT